MHTETHTHRHIQTQRHTYRHTHTHEHTERHIKAFNLCVMCVCLHVEQSEHGCCAHRGQKRSSEPLEMELQGIVGHLMWAWRTRLCGRAASTINRWAISPALRVNRLFWKELADLSRKMTEWRLYAWDRIEEISQALLPFLLNICPQFLNRTHSNILPHQLFGNQNVFFMMHYRNTLFSLSIKESWELASAHQRWNSAVDSGERINWEGPLAVQVRFHSDVQHLSIQSFTQPFGPPASSYSMIRGFADKCCCVQELCKLCQLCGQTDGPSFTPQRPHV